MTRRTPRGRGSVFFDPARNRWAIDLRHEGRRYRAFAKSEAEAWEKRDELRAKANLGKEHHDNSGGPRCWSCEWAIDWNVWRQFCQCGSPATGYRVLGADLDVEFFCGVHFEGLPASGDGVANKH